MKQQKHTSLECFIICQLLGGCIGSNGFHIKWIFGTQDNWKNYNPRSSETAPRIFIFSTAMGAEHSFYVKTIETHSRAFLPLNISAVGSVCVWGGGHVPLAPSANYGPALLLLALTNLDQAIFGSNDIFWLGGRCNFSWLIAETLTGWHTFIVHRTLLTKELCILETDIEIFVYLCTWLFIGKVL